MKIRVKKDFSTKDSSGKEHTVQKNTVGFIISVTNQPYEGFPKSETKDWLYLAKFPNTPELMVDRTDVDIEK